MDVIEQEAVTLEANGLPSCYAQEVHPSGMGLCARCPVARACYEAWVATLTPVSRPAEPQVNGNGKPH